MRWSCSTKIWPRRSRRKPSSPRGNGTCSGFLICGLTMSSSQGYFTSDLLKYRPESHLHLSLEGTAQANQIWGLQSLIGFQQKRACKLFLGACKVITARSSEPARAARAPWPQVRVMGGAMRQSRTRTRDCTDRPCTH